MTSYNIKRSVGRFRNDCATYYILINDKVNKNPIVIPRVIHHNNNTITTQDKKITDKLVQNYKFTIPHFVI